MQTTLRPPEEPLLAVDVGNTAVTLGYLSGGRVRRTERHGSSETSAREIARALRRFCPEGVPARVVYASVVPSRDAAWTDALRRAAPNGASILPVGADLDFGIPLAVPDPASVGADRLANACGAAARYGAPVVAADFGTALTFDVVLSRRGYIGGIIAPGTGMMTRYMAEKTALLPEISPEPVRRPVGRTTVEAMQIGIRQSMNGMVREIVSHLRHRLSEPDFTLVLTGGEAARAVKRLGLGAHHAPDLTLYGLGVIAALNRERLGEGG